MPRKTALFVIAALLTAGGFIWNYSKSTQPPASVGGVTNEADLVFASSQIAKVNSPYTLNLGFASSPTEIPTAFTLHLNYNPKLLSLSSFSANHLWTSSNILENKIDNTKGTATITIGQGFGSKTQNTPQIIALEFIPISSGKTKISLSPESLAAKGQPGTTNTISWNLTASDFSVDIKR